MNPIHKCTCKHPAQDQLHGAQMRVHTPTQKKAKDDKHLVFRCSVCGAEREALK